MTTGVTDVTAVGDGSVPPPHPLDPLTADELRRSRGVIDAAGLLGAGTRFALVQLLEPAKDDVLAWVPGDPIDRRVFSVLLDTDTGDGDRGRGLARRRAGAALDGRADDDPSLRAAGSGRRRAGDAGRGRQGRRPVAGGDADVAA